MSPDEAREFERLRETVAHLTAVQVVVQTPTSDGRLTARADLRTGDFYSIGRLPGGGHVEMIRKGDLTWTRAPVSLWIDLGFTRASAHGSKGKWVVARSGETGGLEELLDPVTPIEWLIGTQPEELTGVERQGDELRTAVVQVGAGRAQIVYESGNQPRLLSIRTAVEGEETVVRYVAFPKRVTTTIPDAADVLDPAVNAD